MGNLTTCNDRDKIINTFVGSCVALCLYDSKQKMGGLAHIMIPGKGSKKQTTILPAKFSENAFERLIEKFGESNDIVAKIVGGAHIFKHENGNGLFDVGKKNTDFIKNLLEERNIPLISEDIGKNFGRWVHLEIKTGLVTIKAKTGSDKII